MITANDFNEVTEKFEDRFEGTFFFSRNENERFGFSLTLAHQTGRTLLALYTHLGGFIPGVKVMNDTNFSDTTEMRAM